MYSSRKLFAAVALAGIVTIAGLGYQTSLKGHSTPSSSVLTWDTNAQWQYLDPGASFDEYGFIIMQNVYEPLLWVNGTSSSQVIPWLAENYSVSPDLRSATFVLRSGITFADGEPVNSSAVYFSLNRLLVIDGSTPVGHGTQGAFLLQRLLNTSLSSSLSGLPQPYDNKWVNEVLSQDFVQMTGSRSFVLHIQHPNDGLPFILANVESFIVAPEYVMQHDVGIWGQPSNGYVLPFPKLTGTESERIVEYFQDEVATCNAGPTPKGCGETYLDTSPGGSLAGTGPYVIENSSVVTSDVVLKSRSDYWGGPNKTPIVPHYQTIDLNFIPEETTREIDLLNSAQSGRSMIADIAPASLYSIADRRSWLQDGRLESVWPGVTVYGPNSYLITSFMTFRTNVTDPFTGEFLQFQPFADQRLRLAFADSVNITDVNIYGNNNLGTVAYNLIPPGLSPEGAFNESIRPRYSYNLTQATSLLIDAMENPIGHFTFANGTVAHQGLFNNTFGCKSLDESQRCVTFIPRTITIPFVSGDSFTESLALAIQNSIQNISVAHNLGLQVQVGAYTAGLYGAQEGAGSFYLTSDGWIANYPSVMDFLGGVFAPNGIFTADHGLDLAVMGTLYQQALTASSVGNESGIVRVSDEMNKVANDEVMYLWTIHNELFSAITSNVKGFYFNAFLVGYYFAGMSQ